MRKGERTRSMIIQKSSNLFNQKGYISSSISDVMKVTKMKKGGIYRHFESKEDLILQAFEYSIQRMGKRFKEILVNDDLSSMDKLKDAINTLKGLVNDDPLPGGCPIMNAALESDDAYPLLAERSREAMDQLLRVIKHIIESGIERGEFKKQTDPEQIAVIWISSLEGALGLSRLYNDIKYIEIVEKHLLHDIQTHLL